MDTTYTKLGDLKGRIARRTNNEKEAAEWFSSVLSKRKTHKVKVRFLQELTEDAELYDPARGTFLGAVEHQAPGREGFQRRALDTTNLEGRDWAQEQHEAGDRRLGWGPKENFYINVAFEEIDEEGNKIIKTAILSRPITSDFVDGLITRFEESDGVGITDKTYWIERVGSGPQTKWKLTVEKDPEKQIDIAGIECYDLAKVAVKHVPYDEQRAFYMQKADIDGRYKQLAAIDAEKNGISVEEAYRQLTGKSVEETPSRENHSEGSSSNAKTEEWNW